MLKSVLMFALTLLAAAVNNPVLAASPKGTTIIRNTGQPAEPLVFTAAPRESAQAATDIYEPIARYLSQALNRPVVYRYVGNWGVYRTQMLRGEYDLVFDGPHFNSYRMEKLRHQLLVRFPVNFQYVTVARDDFVFVGMQRLYRYSFCAFAPPNLGTLILLDLFDNPMRQPHIAAAVSSEDIYQGVVNKRCAVGVLPLAHFRRLNQDGRVRVLYTSDELPGQALSAGPRVTPGERLQLIEALVSPGAAEPTARLRATWQAESGFVRASAEDYAPFSRYLRNEWGFY